MIGAATSQIAQQLPPPPSPPFPPPPSPPPPPPPPQQQAAPAASSRFSPSVVNAFRVAAVAQRLSLYLSSGADKGSCSSSPRDTAMEFLNSCLSLARGIDYAVANNEVLPKAHELPALLKRLCLLKDDGFYLAIIMVLMISVKNACKFKWFSEEDCQELLALVDEIGKSFQSPRDTTVGSTASFSLVSTIMARFYPRLKMGQILTSLEVEPGYGALVSDFHISKTVVHSPEEKIRFFVAQTDNIETSACIITPPQDTGPQMPTYVTQMLKYGTNLLQAVGQFNGHYVIIIAFMSVASPPDSSTISDYIPATIAAADSDSDIIEVASRICLNCPISRTRIQVPVKGHSCKHHQCFDYSNFLSINSSKPSWRCPHCNRPVCFTDIRVDQNIVKVLQEVGDDISEVTITVDGSWKAVMECNDDLYETPNDTMNCLKQGSKQRKSTVSLNAIPSVLDLTGDDDEMDGVFTSEPEERKPLQSDFLIRSIPTNPSLPSTLNNGSTVTQLAPGGNNLPGFVQTPSTSNAGQEMQIHGGLPQAISAIVTSPLAGAVSSTPAQDAQFLGNFIDSMMQAHLSVPNNLQMQQSPVVNTAVGHEYGNTPSIPRHVPRTPVGIQALPARTQTPSTLQRSRSMMNPMIASGPSMAPQPTMSTTQPLEGFGSVGMHVERQQQISRPPANPLQVSNIPPSALLRSSPMQDRSFSTGQSVPMPMMRPSPGQFQGRPRISGLFQAFQNQHLQQALNPTTSPSTTHSPSMGRPLLPRSAPVSQTPGSSRLWPSAQQPAMPVQTPVQLQSQPSRIGTSLPDSFRASAGDQRANTGVPSPSGGDGTGELSVEQNWRPTRPMRGSITGRSHLDNNLTVIRPTQQAQATPSPSAVGSASPTVPPHLRVPNPIINSRSHLGYPRGTQ
ncbi:E4 SUMO-protein ligase PIAL2 isoform X2 [Syzygium oleosum]|uniref:E4 SUMO-protein ligase PIAL2 isoform X2 n=1 Tax=Syzygium oleosum TaxID=219896 RepID=UPI0024BB89C6|nr:E4 SUMO-protein ligase PIAL2 isoform X2 [Syzygium oleosum]